MHEKIGPHHQERKAILVMRQSSGHDHQPGLHRHQGGG